MEGPTVWRVLVVEDDAQTCEFFARSIRACAQLQLVGTAATLAQARAWLADHAQAVDVLLTDLGLPDGSGLELIRLLRERNPACETLVISMFGDEDNVLASIEAGALGYIHKDSTPDDIAQTILDMRAGASPISPMIARRVLHKLRAVGPATDAHDPKELELKTSASDGKRLGFAALTQREGEVLDFMARGFSYAEIAQLQSVSMHTVQSHVKKLYKKLAVNSKTEAVFEATRQGFFEKSDGVGDA